MNGDLARIEGAAAREILPGSQRWLIGGSVVLGLTGRDVRVTDEYSAEESVDRKREYFDWAKSVVDRVHRANAQLEKRFDQLYAMRP